MARDSWYLLSAFPVALTGFLVAVLGVILAGGAITMVPVLGASLYLLRHFADFERRRIAGVLDTQIARPVYRTSSTGSGVLHRLLQPILDVQAWLDLLHAFVVFFVSLLTAAVLVAWCVAGAGGSLLWAYGWALGLAEWEIVGGTAIGLLFVVSLRVVVRTCAVWQATLGRTLLSGLAELQKQRQAAVSAEAVTMRKLERDIHDGPQQRLVRVAVDLGRAQHLFETDPVAARQVVAQALNETEETIDELRALSRGIAPPILLDRGLVAALAAVAGRCTVAVTLETESIDRLDEAVETAAYFVVAEALVNVAKHSRASACTVRLERRADRLVVTVTDDGVGGAHVAKGHGLAGLADRATAIGGVLAVHSPEDGPTTVTAEMPYR